MNQVRLTFRVVLFVSVMLMLASFTQAQASRTWVSGVGDDVNPCSRTAPCKTFAGAISKTAMGGEIDLLDPAGAGSVTITKSITLDGTGSLSSILAAGTSGININITDAKDTAKAVRLRGLSINGIGTGTNGINIVAANSVTIEDSVVDGFTVNGINVNSGTAFVRNTSIRNNAVGISVGTGATAGLANVSLVFNGTSMVGDTLIQQFGGVVAFGNKKGNSK
jgi:hypothetical protein